MTLGRARPRVVLGLAAGAALAALSTSGGAARADAPAVRAPAPPALAVDVAPTCGALDPAELRRLIAIELGATLAALGGATPRVAFDCAPPDAVRITVSDPLTNKSVARSVTAPADDAARARLLAIAAGQLVLASWMELLVADPPAPPSSPARPAAARAVARTAARGAIARRGTPFDLGAAGGVGLRDPAGAAFATAQAGVLARIGVAPRLRLLFGARGEYGRVHRTLGDGELITASFVAGAAARPIEAGPFTLDAELTVAVGWARVAGVPADDTVQAGATDGPIVDVATALVPALRWRALSVGLELRAGVAVTAPLGVVAGEAPVAPAGLNLGAALRLGVSWNAL